MPKNKESRTNFYPSLYFKIQTKSLNLRLKNF